MEIQKVVPADLEAITRLVSEVSDKDILPLFDEQGKQMFRERVLPDLITVMDDQRFLSIKAVVGEELLGFAALRDGNYLTHLFVSGGSQRAGWGRELLNHLLSWTGADEIRLRASVNSVGFYQGQGFRTTGDEAEVDGIRFVPMSLIRK